jgi:hypothetical protein
MIQARELGSVAKAIDIVARVDCDILEVPIEIMTCTRDDQPVALQEVVVFVAAGEQAEWVRRLIQEAEPLN